MGSYYACVCSDCGHNFKFYEGSGRYSQPLICNTCGKSAYIPRVAPRPNRHSLRKEFEKLVNEGTASASDYPEIKPFNRDELKAILESKQPLDGLDAWLDEELAVLVELRNPCACGGALDLASKTAPKPGSGASVGLNELVRCPKCRSRKYAWSLQGLWD